MYLSLQRPLRLIPGYQCGLHRSGLECSPRVTLGLTPAPRRVVVLRRAYGRISVGGVCSSSLSRCHVDTVLLQMDQEPELTEQRAPVGLFGLKFTRPSQTHVLLPNAFAKFLPQYFVHHLYQQFDRREPPCLSSSDLT